MNMMAIVFWFELRRTITKWSFWLRTLSIPAMMVLIIALSIFSNTASDSAYKELQEGKFSVLVLDNSGLVAQSILEGVGAQAAESRETGILAAQKGTVDAFIVYPVDPSKEVTEIYAKDDGLMSNGKYSATATSLLQASIAAKLTSKSEVMLLQAAPQTKLITYKDGQETKGFGRAVAPGLFLIMFYVVIILLGNQMLTTTTEEKENRVVEMILTSVSSKDLIWGKIWALIVMGVIQVAVILVPLLIAYFGFRAQLNIPALDMSAVSWAIGPIVAGALLFASGFIAFTALLVTIGSAVPSAKEASGYFGAVMIMILLPFYAIAAIVTSPDQLIVRVLSYFPLTAPMTLMIRNAAGNASTLELILGIVVTLVTGILLMKLAVRTFRYGSLEYARKLSIREILSLR